MWITNRPGECLGGTCTRTTRTGLEGANTHKRAAPSAVEAASEFGAEILQEPEAHPWGLRAVVVDPDGRPLEVFEPIGHER